MLKRTRMVIALGVVITVIGCGINSYSKLNKEYEGAVNELNRSEQSVYELQKNKTVLIEENESLKISNEELKKEIERVLEAYDELNKLYQQEIQPVSFDPYNLLQESGATVSKLNKFLAGTGLEGLGCYYVQAEKKHGVNAIFILALTIEESAWGSSDRAIYQNNLSGFEVYSDSAEGAYFSSKEESIDVTAELLRDEYLSSDGIYHNGYSIYDVNVRYCPNDGGNWSRNITKIAYQIVDEINSRL